MINERPELITDDEKAQLLKDFYCETLIINYGVPERWVRRLAEQSVQVAAEFANRKLYEERDRITAMLHRAYEEYPNSKIKLA